MSVQGKNCHSENIETHPHSINVCLYGYFGCFCSVLPCVLVWVRCCCCLVLLAALGRRPSSACALTLATAGPDIDLEILFYVKLCAVMTEGIRGINISGTTINSSALF